MLMKGCKTWKFQIQDFEGIVTPKDPHSGSTVFWGFEAHTPKYQCDGQAAYLAKRNSKFGKYASYSEFRVLNRALIDNSLTLLLFTKNTYSTYYLYSMNLRGHKI